MTDTMTCMETDNGRLRAGRRPMPVPGPDEVLIRVRAAGVNRPDLLQLDGLYPPPPGASDVLGLECAGEIADVGENVAGWQEGDKVCALLTGGGYAQYATAPVGQCLPLPRGLDFAQAASLPETYFTVWSNLFGRAHLKAGETLLVHGGSSGIGVAAIQLAKRAGARVMVTAGSRHKCQACLDLGADLAVNYKEQDFVPAARDFGAEHGLSKDSPPGVDVILDMVGGDYVQRNIKALAPDGRLVNIAFLNGSKVELDLMTVMLKRLTLTGSTLRARPPAFKAAIARELQTHVWPWLESGAVRPVVQAVMPFEQAPQALDRLRQGGHVGKIVLEMP